MFSTGQKVVCVDAECFDEALRAQYDEWPVKDVTYTIRDSGLGHDTVRRDEMYCTLVELVNPIAAVSGIEKGFRQDRFAPLNPDLEGVLEEEEPSEHELVPLVPKGSPPVYG